MCYLEAKLLVFCGLWPHTHDGLRIRERLGARRERASAGDVEVLEHRSGGAVAVLERLLRQPHRAMGRRTGKRTGGHRTGTLTGRRRVQVDVGEQLQVRAARVTARARAETGAAERVVLAARMRTRLSSRIAHRHQARLLRLARTTATSAAFRLRVWRHCHTMQRLDALVAVQVVRVERCVQAIGQRVEEYALQTLELRPELGGCWLIARLDPRQLLDHILRREIQSRQDLSKFNHVILNRYYSIQFRK